VELRLVPAACGGAVTGASAATKVKWKVEPWPGALSAHIVPPISSLSRLLIAKPSPVPPKRRLVEASTWLKDWNSSLIRSSGMPIPVSRTATCSRWPPGAEPSRRTTTTTSPSSVNFTALPTRLRSTCRNRAASPVISGGTSESIRQPSSRSLSAAWVATSSSADSTHSRSSKGRRSSSSLPDSIFEKSSTSSITRKRTSPLVRTTSTKSRCS
jgi:hypothetical protein